MRERFLYTDATSLNDNHWLIITDHIFWVNNAIEISTWAQNSDLNFDIEGLVVKFKSQEDVTIFLLRWG